MTNFENLNQLFEAMRNNDPNTVDQHGQFRADLPTFGGNEPANTSEVWSWDNENVIVGSCAHDLNIENRDD